MYFFCIYLETFHIFRLSARHFPSKMIQYLWQTFLLYISQKEFFIEREEYLYGKKIMVCHNRRRHLFS